MCKQIRAKFVGDGVFHPHLRDTTPGKSYDGLALEVGDVNYFNRVSQTGDEFQFTDDSGDTVVTRLHFGWEVEDVA